MSTIEHFQNLVLARLLWVERVKPEQVASALGYWRCGTHGCFGGWLATWREFERKGVVEGDRGEPVLRFRFDLGPYDVAFELFGDDALFDARPFHPSDKKFPNASDHEIVTRRLDADIEVCIRELGLTDADVDATPDTAWLDMMIFLDFAALEAEDRGL
jgi:hypothetical protein